MEVDGAAQRTRHPFHRHPDARIIVFVSGRYRERSVGECAVFAPGDVIVRPAHYAHDGCALSANADYLRLAARPEALAAFFSQYGWRARRCRYGGCLHDLIAAATEPSAGEAILSTEMSPLSMSVDQGVVGDVARALDTLLPDRLNDIADANNLDPWQLTRRFHRAYGITPSRYRQHARIQTALRLLAETSYTLSAIAAAAGFSDQSHLGRALRAETGCTPAKLRRQLAA